MLGPNAAVARTLGGGSATVFPYHTVSPLEGLRAALDAEVSYARGVQTHTRPPVAEVSSADVRFLAADGTVLGAEHRETGEYTWMGTLDPAVAAIEVHTTLRATVAGEHLIGCSGPGRFRLSLGGSPVFDVELVLPENADPGEALFSPAAARRPGHARRGRGDRRRAAARGRRPDPGHLPARPRAAGPRRRRRARAGRGTGPRRRRRRGRGGHDARGRERGLRPHDAGPARPPGRARPPRQRRPAAHDRRRQRRRAGADAVARRGARRAAVLVREVRRPATRSPTSCSAPPSPAGGSRPPGRCPRTGCHR